MQKILKLHPNTPKMAKKTWVKRDEFKNTSTTRINYILPLNKQVIRTNVHVHVHKTYGEKIHAVCIVKYILTPKKMQETGVKRMSIKIHQLCV